MALNNLGNLLLGQGDDALAERHFREALRLAKQLGDSVGTSTAFGNLGEAYLARGEAAEAATYLDGCLALIAETDHHEYESEVRHARGRAFMALGDDQAARHELEQAMELARKGDNTAYIGVVETARAELALAQGDASFARGIALQAEMRLRTTPMQLELGRALAMQARVSDPVMAVGIRDEAIEIFRKLGAKRDRERALAIQPPQVEA